MKFLLPEALLKELLTIFVPRNLPQSFQNRCFKIEGINELKFFTINLISN
jgi:hypothetical protein